MRKLSSMMVGLLLVVALTGCGDDPIAVPPGGNGGSGGGSSGGAAGSAAPAVRKPRVRTGPVSRSGPAVRKGPVARPSADESPVEAPASPVIPEPAREDIGFKTWPFPKEMPEPARAPKNAH